MEADTTIISHKVCCPFCKDVCRFVYKMNSYSIYKCLSCGTGQAYPMPREDTLKKFYSGFLFSASPNYYQPVLASAKRLFPLLGFHPNKNHAMLDVGGGGGFYAKAFKELYCGESTYVDLDEKACTFAKSSGIDTVLHGDATQLCYGKKKYDFIMCRHVIEHLPNPTFFITKILTALSENGLLLLMCPNGNSLEYLAHPQSNIAMRINTISRSSHMAKSKVVQRLIFGDMLHGIDPPRHLWAITQKGIQNIIDNKKYISTIITRPLTDTTFSPYYRPASFWSKAFDLFGTYFCAKIHGGTHLVAVIRKKECPSQ